MHFHGAVGRTQNMGVNGKPRHLLEPSLITRAGKRNRKHSFAINPYGAILQLDGTSVLHVLGLATQYGTA
ncbi:hypothetical protein J6590_011253 [Homalodisca vitripennis]|nr:hypothetical protein J6590_011253 [Homalodisca vitripennis]